MQFLIAIAETSCGVRNVMQLVEVKTFPVRKLLLESFRFRFPRCLFIERNHMQAYADSRAFDGVKRFSLLFSGNSHASLASEKRRYKTSLDCIQNNQLTLVFTNHAMRNRKQRK